MTYDEYQEELDKIRKEKGKNSDNSWNTFLNEKWQYLDAHWKTIKPGEKYFPPTAFPKDNQYTRAQKKVKQEELSEQARTEAWKSGHFGDYE